jgi:thiol:disulfide interchange protein DsbD
VLFFAIAAFAVSLPKSGAWMEAVKSVFGVVMLVAALYFLRNVAPLLAELGRPTRGWLLGSLALATAGLLVGAVHLSFHASALQRLRKTVGVAAMVCGLFGVISGVLAPTGESSLVWLRDEAEGLRQARALGKPALLDFYADWCLPCKELEKSTLHHQEVARALASMVLVKVDCTTDDDPAVTAAKKRWQAQTLPTLVLVGADGQLVRKIDHVVTPEELLRLLGDVKL